tara:strand:+ start:10996 stop:11520 length:525 start_codon:yes stop_codon:yes gene_type:complete
MKNKLLEFSPTQLGAFRKELLSELSYSKTTGLLTWRKARVGVKPGKVAGHTNRLGYVQIGFKNTLWLAHQLIWLMVKNEVAQEIDHKDGVPQNNKWLNLRGVTHAQNNWNKKGRKDSTSGHRGVSFQHGKWRAYITVNRSNQIHLGRFSKKEEAVTARLEAEKKHFNQYKYGSL